MVSETELKETVEKMPIKKGSSKAYKDVYKFVRLGREATGYFNLARAKIISADPNARVTDELIIKKALKDFLGVEIGNDRHTTAEYPGPAN